MIYKFPIPMDLLLLGCYTRFSNKVNLKADSNYDPQTPIIPSPPLLLNELTDNDFHVGT